jgi:hypothetical protein
MSPRIQEFATAAKLEHCVSHVRLQDFAERIVGECMRMCEVAQAGYLTHGLEKEAAGAISVKQYIEEYLGAD